MGKRNVILLALLLLTLAPLTSSYEFCENATSENELEIIEIIDLAQNDEENWEWGPTEQVTVRVEVENKNFTERNFQVELFFIDEDQVIKNITTDNTNLIKTISLEEDISETLNFSFQLDNPSNDIYHLHAKLSDPNDENICTSLKATSSSTEATITIEQEEKIVVVREVTGPVNTTTGSLVEYTVEVINLGNTEEERVMVIIYNANFNLREEKEIIGLKSEALKIVTFNFTIPSTTTSQQENILFSTEYDYSNETGHYYQSSAKAKIFSIQINSGNNTETQTNPTEETQNQTGISQNQTNATQNQTEIFQNQTEESTEDKKTTNSYLWPIAITLSLITIIIITTLLLLKKKPSYTTESSSSKVKEYVENINNSTPSTPQDEPSETNTANTKVPPTSQNPSEQPRSPPRPATDPSSPE